MSLSWAERKDHLNSLLQACGDNEEGLALDRVLHGQTTIGRTSKTIKIDSLRFTDKDLIALGTLDRGQFGVIDVVRCVLDGRIYVRKSTEKVVALRCREQCSPQTERDILLLSKLSSATWAPHLLCSFQTSTHLNLIMDYAEGGTLWDVLESSPHGKILEADLQWWAPQAVCAIHWCHSQGFAHRDIKPHNFVLTSRFHLRLIDFGSAAPLSPPEPDGSQNIPQCHSLVPCGTCDYISPEILQAHEDALLALELSDNSLASSRSEQTPTICGPETDWWSLGVMLYELVYGVAPFFANDIRTTYLRIMNHETSLRFDKTTPISESCRDLLQRFLTTRERRLGRRDMMEITGHPFFRSIHWAGVGTGDAPSDLHVPHFTYIAPTTDASSCAPLEPQDEDTSHPFHFSALFQSSVSTSPEWSVLRSTSRASCVSGSPKTEASFIGFSWGPPRGAFLPTDASMSQAVRDAPKTPLALFPVQSSSYLPHERCGVPYNRLDTLTTPIRPRNVTPYHTLPRTSTIGRTPTRRAVSDREAMRQLVDCISMSARKKVLASGRKPRILDSITQNRTSTIKKELRFGPTVTNPDGMSGGFPPVPVTAESEVTESGSEGPPSPSPSPRPGSAMSMLSRRSVTPTITSHSTQLVSLPSSPPSGAYRARGYGDLGDEVFSQLEDRHATLVSQLYSIQAQIDHLKELIEP